MCFNYCTAFPSLFEAIDKRSEGDVLKISSEDKTAVIQECYQCKICYVKCPYTDKDKHSYNLNFPALMQRAVHVQSKRKGVPLRDKILQNADLAGRFSSGLHSKIVNFFFSSPFFRNILEKALGVHRDKEMPRFHRKPFFRWYCEFRKKNEALVNTEKKVVLFSTCFVNYNHPELGKDALFTLEKNGIQVAHPKQNCCGMPGLNTGDLKWALKKMKKNIKFLLPYVQDGYKILAINPTCSMTLKQEYTAFLPKEYQEKAEAIAQNTYDLHEYLFELKKEEKLNRDFKSSPGKIGYHVPCHLRAQHIGYRSRDIMKLIPDANVQIVDECCGHNGNWAMKKENFDLSLRAGARSFKNLGNSEAHEISTDCPLAGIQLKQGMKLPNEPLHPIQILAKAYRSPEEGGFSQGV